MIIMNDDFDSLLEIILALWSIALGYLNLDLNEEQVKKLDVHLEKQDTEFLAKIIKQNEIIINQNKNIISLLTKHND